MHLTFINCTAISVSLYYQEDTFMVPKINKLFLKEGSQPYKVIPPSGTILKCKMETGSLPSWVEELKGNCPFLVGAVNFIEADWCPNVENTIYIVSNLYRSAMSVLNSQPNSTSQLATVVDTVYDDPTNPKPVGCLGLALG